MDFHSLQRRELQALCKRNRIPANTTNVAMADALHSLKLEGRLIEISQETMEGSPKNMLVGSVRKASARRGTAPSAGASVEPKEQPASPLPRARRVTVKASEMRRLVSEGEGEDEVEKKEDVAEMTTPVSVVKRSTAKKPAARNTRRGAGKKENAETAEEGPLETAKTPASRNGRRTAVRRVAETPAMAEQEGQDAVFSPRISTRRTRQSSKSTAVVDLTTSALRRSTRIRARTSVPVMEDLSEPEQVAEGTEIKDCCEKTLDLGTGNVSDLKETKGVEFGITGNNCEKDCDLVVADVVDVVKEDGAPAETTEIDDASEDETIARRMELGVEINIPIESGDGADEELSGLQEGIGGSDEKLSDLQEEIGQSDKKLSESQEEIEGGADRNQDNITHGNDSEQDSVSQHELDVDTEEVMTQEVGDCEQNSDGVFENTILPQCQLATDAKEGIIQKSDGFNEQLVAEVEECSEVATQEIEDCEEDCNGIFENAIVPRHQLAVDAKEDGMIQEADGFDEQLEAEVEECSEVDDAKEGMTQEIEDCEQEVSNGIFQNATVPQHQLTVDAKEDGMIQEADGFDQQLVAEVEECSEVDDAKEGMTQEIEDCEQEDSNGIFENAAIVPQHLLAVDAKEDGMIQQADRFDQQLVEAEDFSVEQETNEAGTAASSEVEGLERLVTSLESLEIASDVEWQSEKEEDEVTEELQVPAKSQASALPEAIESAMNSPEKAAVEEPKSSPAAKSSYDVITSESKIEEEEESDAAAIYIDSSAELAVAEKEESKKNLDVDYNLISMRKLRTEYKEKLIEKVEGRRLPLAEINDNQC